MGDWRRRRVGFFAVLADLAEASRLVRIAERYRELGGDAVPFSHGAPCSLSARKAGLPLVWIVPGTALPPFFRAGRGTFPDALGNAVARVLPARLKDWGFNLKPELAAHLDRDGPGVYFTLGSSGQRKVYLEALKALSATGYRVVAAHTTILGDGELPATGGNVLLEKLVPAEPVSRMVDPAVIHGGQGTFYTAAHAGRPVVGIPMQPEQQHNLDILVRSGSAIRLSKRGFRGRHLLAAIEAVLDDHDRFRAAAEAPARRLPAVDGAQRGAERIREIVPDRIGSGHKRRGRGGRPRTS